MTSNKSWVASSSVTGTTHTVSALWDISNQEAETEATCVQCVVQRKTDIIFLRDFIRYLINTKFDKTTNYLLLKAQLILIL